MTSEKFEFPRYAAVSATTMDSLNLSRQVRCISASYAPPHMSTVLEHYPSTAPGATGKPFFHFRLSMRLLVPVLGAWIKIHEHWGSDWQQAR